MKQKTFIQALYKKLLTLYPRVHRERFSESMQQTFNDLYREWKREGRSPVLMIMWTFAETSFGIIWEHVSLIRDIKMKTLLSTPKSAAMTSLILALPLGLTFIAFTLDIRPLANLLNSLLTVPGQPGQINMPGRLVLFVGLLLMPVAFVLNLTPFLHKAGPGSTRVLSKINLIAGVLILLLIGLTWGSLFAEQVYCLQGIRCD